MGNGKYKNPVLYADYSDPDVCAVGNDYYLTASSFNCVPGLPILHSTDLVHWTIIGHALSRLTPDSIFSNVAQGGAGSRAVEAINRFNARYPQEKVCLHFDNTAYYLNETIWWKAYLFRTDNDSLGSLSRVLYIELVDPAGQVVETQKSVVDHGQANGQFLLGRYTQSGFYQVRAYTRYMLNWGSSWVFSRVIPVFKNPTHEGDYSEKVIQDQPAYFTGKKQENAVSGDTTRYLVNFYPEGGCLVNSLKSRVAFEVTDGKGKAIDVTGWLCKNDEKVQRVQTVHEGRGAFFYTPDGKEASLKLTMPDGKTKTYKLPAASAQGRVMTVDTSSPDVITWTTNATRTYKSQPVYMLLIHNGKATEVKTPLSRKAVPDGCSQLALINADGALLCSRMVFNYPDRQELNRLKVTVADSLIWPDKQMTLKVNTVPQAAMSLSVCDAETQLAAENHSAATWYLLSSDLKGYIHNPEYYLEADDEAHREATDLLMLVQGWRKYDVESMDGKNQWKKMYPTEHTLLVDGRLKAYSKRNKVNGANLEIYLLNSLGSRLHGDVTTDSTGYYVFVVPDCVGNWDMIMHTTLNDKDKRYYITVNRNFSPDVAMPSWYSMNEDAQIVPTLNFTLDKAHIDSIPMDVRAHWLDNVEVKAKHVWKTPREFWERESRGAQYASIRYDMEKAADEYADKGEITPTLIDWLKAKNPLFDGNDNLTGQYAGQRGKPNLYGDGPTYGGKGIMWIVNNWFICGTSLHGFGYKDVSKTEDLSASNYHIPFDIAEARSVYISTEDNAWKHFFKAPQLEGWHYVTIFVYTKYDEPVPKGYRSTTFNGFNIKEEYQQLMSMEGADLAGSDYRRTLYWNPNVKLDATGCATLKFKNNSTSRHMTVSAVGFTPDGKPLVAQ